MEGNKEHMFMITQSDVVLRLLADFEKTWSQSIPLTDEVLERVTEEYLLRTLSDRDSKKQSRRPSEGRGARVSRETCLLAHCEQLGT